MIVNLSSSLVHNNKNINNGCNSKNIDKKLLSMNQRSCTIQNVDDNDDITQQQHLNDNCVNGKEEKSIVYGHPTKTNSRRNFLSSLITSTTILATSSFNRRANAASIVEEEYPTTTAITPTPKSAPAAVTGSTTNNKLLPYTIDTANPNLIQYETAGMIPRIYFEEKRSIYGFVERVIDGDTIRVTHVPKFPIDGYIPEPIRKRGISDITISIRFYGVDAPETAKNKNQTSQPFGDDAKLFTSNNVYHQMVKITLLQKDKYGRAVGAVETISNPSKDLSIELAKRGLAELYTGGGAQYWVSFSLLFY